jgi:hypothetical protein
VRHRVYQAHIGRWATRDPLGYVDGMGLYEYVNARPVTRSDPLGLFWMLAGAGAPKSCDDAIKECFNDPETQRIKQEMEKACNGAVDPLSGHPATIDGPRCCGPGEGGCGKKEDERKPNGTTTTGNDGRITICICTFPADLGGGPLSLDVCKTVRHEMIHAWQTCSRWKDRNTVPRIPTYPRLQQPEVHSMCREIGAFCGAEGGMCDKDAICQNLCGTYEYPNTPDCRATCEAIFDLCKNYWPQPPPPPKTPNGCGS